MSVENKLTVYNGLNVIAFGLSWLLNSGIGDGPDVVFDGMEKLRQRYESIVTPASTTYLMAHFVLLLQGVFTVCQLMPKFRGSVMVHEAVKYWFLLSAVAQLIWSLNLGMEGLFGSILSAALMGGLFYCNSRILTSQAHMTFEDQTPEEYWMLRFPFSVNFAWILAVLVESINAIFVQMEFPLFLQVALGFISLAFFGGVGWKMLFANGKCPNYVIPSVLAWFSFGIAFPSDDGPGVELEGILGFIFAFAAGLVGFGLTFATAFLFHKNEYKDDKDETFIKGADSDSDNSDTVYVSAPEGSGAIA